MTKLLSSPFSRRSFLKTSAMSAAAIGLAPGGLLTPAMAQAAITVGFIYVGPKDDYGYNQAHAEGAAMLKEMAGITVVEEENVPENVDVQKTMESMINLDGATLVFPTSFGYFDPHMLEMAKKYPDIQFRHCGGLWTEGTHPANTGSYFGYIGQGQYLNGIAAAYASKSKKIGFVAAKPIPQVLQNINSFLLGARSVDPAITCQVIFTGEWSLAVKEAEATNALVDQGADVITCHVDSPKVVVETAEGRGVKVCGHNASQAPLAPKGFITGAEYKWETIYKTYADAIAAGEVPPNFLVGGYNNDMLRNSAYGAGATPEAIAAADAAIEGLKACKPIYTATLKDNAGNVVVDKDYDNYDPYLDGMNWLLEGVQGSIT